MDKNIFTILSAHNSIISLRLLDLVNLARNLVKIMNQIQCKVMGRMKTIRGPVMGRRPLVTDSWSILSYEFEFSIRESEFVNKKNNF